MTITIFNYNILILNNKLVKNKEVIVMKDTLNLFFTDLNDFVKNNWKILTISLVAIVCFQYLGKGDVLINIATLSLHIAGDIMMIIAIGKYAECENKSGSLYMVASNLFFIGVGIIAVLQSVDGKNWQYFIGNIPFWIATTNQIMNAWDIKLKSLFNYKLTALASLLIIIIYIQFDLVYSHVWIQILGMSLLPIFLSIADGPKVFIARVVSVGLFTFGTLIDLLIQFETPGVVPASSISSFFIALIAFFGFAKNASVYIEKVDVKNTWTLKTLWLIERF